MSFDITSLLWIWNDIVKCKTQTAPEGIRDVTTLSPLDVGGGPQYSHHAASDVKGTRILQRHQDHDVITVHGDALAVPELELAPRADGEVGRQHHEDPVAGVDAVCDVVHDVLARDEVSLVDAQPEPPACFKRREKLALDPR